MFEINSEIQDEQPEEPTSKFECAECKREIVDSSRVREVRDQEGNLKNLCKDCYKKIKKQKGHHIPKGGKSGVKLTPKVELKRMCQRTEADVIEQAKKVQPGIWENGEEIRKETMELLMNRYIRADKEAQAFRVCKGEREMQRVVRKIRIGHDWKLPAKGQKKNLISKPTEPKHLTPKILQMVEERTTDMVDYKELVISATQSMIYKKTKDDVLVVINDLFERHFDWSVIPKPEQLMIQDNTVELVRIPEQSLIAQSTNTTSMSSTSTESEVKPEEMMG